MIYFRFLLIIRLVIFLVSLEKFEGKNVIAAGGHILGQVKGAEVNPTTWQITHLQVKLSGQASDQLGFKKRFGTQTVCLPVNLISAAGDVITVGSTLDELSKNTQISECLP